MESTVKYNFWISIILTDKFTLCRTVLDGQFDWGGRLPKCNGGAPRYPQYGWKSYFECNGIWKSYFECNGIRVLDCEIDKSSRYESRA